MKFNKVTHLVGHHHPIYALAASSSVPRFYSAGHDKGVVEWDATQWQFIRVLCPIPQTAYQLQLVPEWNALLVALQSGTVHLVDLDSGQFLYTNDYHKKPVFAIGYDYQEHSDTLRIYIASEDGVLTQWLLKKSSEVQQLASFQLAVPIRCLAINARMNTLVLGDKQGFLHFFDRDALTLIKSVQAHEQGVTSVRFSPDGKCLFTSGRDARMCVFDSLSYSQIHEWVPHLFAAYAIQFHPSLPVFATASRDKSVKIWSADDFRLLRSLSIEKGFEAHRLSVNSLTWDASGKYLITAGDDKIIMVWEWESFANFDSAT